MDFKRIQGAKGDDESPEGDANIGPRTGSLEEGGEVRRDQPKALYACVCNPWTQTTGWRRLGWGRGGQWGETGDIRIVILPTIKI